MNNKALIISGGNNFEALLDKFFGEDYFTICADSGGSFLFSKDQTPDMIIGDLDSIEAEAVSHFSEREIKLVKAPAEKDETDTELAVNYVIENRFEEVVLLGATGTRLDHTLGNISLLNKLASHGIRARIVDSHNEITIVEKYHELKLDSEYKYVSILPYGGDVKGITLEGFKYRLEKAEIKRDAVIGISNEITEEKSRIWIEEGRVLVIRSRD